MKFEGTPGPWFIKPVSQATVDGDLFIIQTNNADGKGYHVAYASTWGDNEESAKEAMSNAKLLVAAPDLLEALQEMVAIVKKNSYPQPDKPSSNYARAEYAESVIAKAIGKEE